MIQIKKTILTLVALLAVTTGAWATDVITVTWSSGNTYENNNSKDGVTLSGDIVRYYGDEWQLAYSESKGTFTTELGNFTKIEIAGGYIDGFSGEGWSGRTWTGNAAAVPFGGYLTDNFGNSPWTITFTIEPASDAPAPSGPEVAWNKAEKTGSFTMPGGNVTLEPEYYPQAALTAAPTAINDVPATTDGAIVKAGTVKNIGSTETAQGTVMYYVSPTALDDAALLALAADKWTADVPTAAHLAEGQAYVYYYVRGNDSDNDEENFSDGDIKAANKLEVTIAAEPLWNAEFDLTNAPEADKTDKWSTDIPEGGVTKGQTVTVTYTGSKKVIGVKAEKKAAAAAGIVNPVVGQVIGSDGNNYDANATLPDGVDKVAMIAYVSGSNGLALALTDEGIYTWDKSSPYNKDKTAPEICSALNTSKAVTGGTWKLPSMDEWMQMFSANGGNEGSYTGLNTALGNAGGTALMENDEYWSSSEVDEGYAWLVELADGNASWTDYGKHYSRCVRACLAF